MQPREAVSGTHVFDLSFRNQSQVASFSRQVPLCTDSSPVAQLQVQGTGLPGWDWFVPI